MTLTLNFKSCGVESVSMAGLARADADGRGFQRQWRTSRLSRAWWAIPEASTPHED